MIEYKNFENLEASSIKMTVGVNGDETNRVYNQVLDDYCRKTSLPGFRPGKVPRQVILRKFAGGILYEAAAQLVNETIQEALKEADKSPISSPKMDNLPELEPGASCEFSVTYDVFPEIDLGEYHGVAIEEKSIQIRDEDKQKELERLAESHAVYINQDDGSVDGQSVVTVDYVELDDAGEEMEATRRKDFVLNMSNADSPLGIESQISGMKVGETRIVSRLPTQTSADGSAEDKAGEGSENTTENHPKIKVTVQELKERSIPALDDEFARDVSEDFKTLEELKDKISTEMEGNARDKIHLLKVAAITERLLEESRIEPPRSMLEEDLTHAWRGYVQRLGVREDEMPDSHKEEMMASWEESALKSVKTRLLYSRIVKEENITVDDEEIDMELRKNAEKYGMNVEEWEKRFGGEAYRDYLKNQMVEKRLFDFLVESAQVSPGEEVGYFELLNL